MTLRFGRRKQRIFGALKLVQKLTDQLQRSRIDLFPPLTMPRGGFQRLNHLLFSYVFSPWRAVTGHLPACIGDAFGEAFGILPVQVMVVNGCTLSNLGAFLKITVDGCGGKHTSQLGQHHMNVGVATG
ncbi:hypothetical protein AO392_17640 [Pseudomonas putida]|nr:hypothetical protein AO392_17640 [Pseudomonas putida]